MKIDCSPIDRFEQIFAEKIAFEQAQKFMVAYLSLISAPFPRLAHQGFEVAKEFLRGSATSEQLANTRDGCWAYLDRHKASTDFKTPEICILRGVMCLVY